MILTIPQTVVLTIHQTMDEVFVELPTLSISAFIKANLLSIPFFNETRITNPIVKKPIVIQNNKSSFIPPLRIHF